MNTFLSSLIYTLISSMAWHGARQGKVTEGGIFISTAIILYRLSVLYISVVRWLKHN